MSEFNPDLSKDYSHALVPFQRPECESETALPVDSRPLYTDFAGLDYEIEKLKEIGSIFTNRELAQEWDVQVPTGVLLCGPGGVGKTELARAFSREIEAELMEVSVSDVQSMWVGKSNENLKQIFTIAQSADNRAVIFFDEMDGLFSKNAGGNSGVSTALLSEMKSLMTNLRRDQPDTIVVASTNSLSGFDEALLRAGRFDVVLQIPKPNDTARASIFGSYICRKPELYNLGDATGAVRLGESIDIVSLAAATEGMTGADIKAILHAARLKKLVAGVQRGVALTPLTQSDIQQSIKHHRSGRLNAAD